MMCNRLNESPATGFLCVSIAGVGLECGAAGAESGVQAARQNVSPSGSLGFPMQPVVDRSCGTGVFVCVQASLEWKAGCRPQQAAACSDCSASCF